MKLSGGKQHRRGAWTLAAAFSMGAAALLAAGVAVADSGPPPVSGADPYAACSVGAPGFNFPSSEVEPFVAVNPTNSSNIVGVYQQDRWDNGGARGLAASVTVDGGQNWSTVALPFSTCAGGVAYQRASDPWISFGPDGTAYAVGISFDQTTTRNAIAAAVSHDGGSTWGDVHRIIADEKNLFDDKDSVTADPIHPGVAYVVWDRISAGRLNNQPSYFSRTTNFGKIWSKPKRITSNARNQGSIGEIIVVDPRNDTLYDVYDALAFPRGRPTIATENVMVSHNRGKSWSRPVTIASDTDLGVVKDPGTGAALRTGSGLPDAAIDPKTGELYVVWEDSRFSHYQYDEVALSRSKNGGRTWSKPIRVNKKTGLPAVTPMVAVNTNGVVGVSYFDFRTSPTSNPSTLPTSYLLATSPRGGKSFKSEQPITDAPFDLLSAPFAEGYFLSDYQGLAADGTSFVSFFTQATGTETTGGDPNNRTDVYFKNLTP